MAALGEPFDQLVRLSADTERTVDGKTTKITVSQSHALARRMAAVLAYAGVALVLVGAFLQAASLRVARQDTHMAAGLETLDAADIGGTVAPAARALGEALGNLKAPVAAMLSGLVRVIEAAYVVVEVSTQPSDRLAESTATATPAATASGSPTPTPPATTTPSGTPTPSSTGTSNGARRHDTAARYLHG